MPVLQLNPDVKARNDMFSKTSTLLSALAVAVTLAVCAGTAAANDGTPPPPGGAPPPPALDAATLDLPRNARPGMTAAIVLRPASPAAAELKAERVACAFRLGAKSLAGAVRVSGGSAVCTVRIPRNAASKTIRGAIRVVLDNIVIERSFSFRVRPR